MPGRLTFYHNPRSRAAMVRWMLEEVGAEHDIVPIDFEAGDNRRPDFLTVNPMGKIPALVLDDGTVITETPAIIAPPFQLVRQRCIATRLPDISTTALYAVVRRSSARTARDHLDFKVEAGQPVYADGSPGREWPAGEIPFLDRHDVRQLLFGIGVEGRNVDNVIEAAPCCVQHGLEVLERTFDLPGIGFFGRAVFAASDLTGYEQEVA